MSRSGYSDDYGDDDPWALIRWRGAVKSAIRGRRGQAFLKEMLAALDALPEPKLIDGELEADGAVCALGAIGRARGLDMKGIDPYDRDTVAGRFDMSPALASEIMFENDEAVGYWRKEGPEDRFARMRRWIVANIRTDP